jgi:hypothetical protein
VLAYLRKWACWASALVALPIARGILHDAHKPAAEVTWLNTVQMSVCGQQPLLQGIVSTRGLTGNAQRHPPGKIKVGGEECRKGRRVAAARGRQEA